MFISASVTVIRVITTTAIRIGITVDITTADITAAAIIMAATATTIIGGKLRLICTP